MKTFGKRAFAVILVLAIAVGTAFASPLNVGTIGAAKIYDSANALVQDAKIVGNRYTVKTSEYTVVLSNETTTIKVSADTLLQIVRADGTVEVYLLDGSATVTSANDFMVRTTATSYKVKANSTLYIVSSDLEETAFIEGGDTEALNLITNAVTKLADGTYIDNSQSSSAPQKTTVTSYWGERAHQASMPEPVVEKEQTAAAEPDERPSLVWNFSYRGVDASIEAYQGRAEITYSPFITEEEVSNAAAFAIQAYPEYARDILYWITGPGKATATYPETYTAEDFNFATSFIGKALTGYIDNLFATYAAEKQEGEKAPEIVAETPSMEPVAEQVTEKTPIETATKEEIQERQKAEKNFHFGATVGATYGQRILGDGYTSFADGRVGTFMRSVSMYVDPYFRYKGFTFGLHLPFDFKILDFTQKPFIEIDMDNYSWDFNSITASVNTILKFVSILELKGDQFTFKADRASEIDFSSPVYSDLKRIYATKDKLLAQINAQFGHFHLDAFFDDLSLQARMAGDSQYTGLRTGFEFKNFKIGVSAVAEMKADVKNTVFYPGLDIAVPFEVGGYGIELSAGGAAQMTMEGLKGLLAEGMLSVTVSRFTFGAGAAFNYGHHFNDIINNGPATVTSQFEGNSIDVLLKASLMTKHFALKGSIDVPLSLESSGDRLVYNTVKTGGGSVEQISADSFNLQTDLMLGNFTFSVGAVYDGLCGRLTNLAKAIITNTDTENALIALVSPDICTWYAMAEVKFNNLNLFVRADLAESTDDGRLTFPISVGGKVTF